MKWGTYGSIEICQCVQVPSHPCSRVIRPHRHQHFLGLGYVRTPPSVRVRAYDGRANWRIGQVRNGGDNEVKCPSSAPNFCLQLELVQTEYFKCGDTRAFGAY